LGITSNTNESADGTRKTTDSYTNIALFWPGGVTPYQIPRLAFDVNVASGFTVGGSIGFASLSGTHKVEQPTGTTDEDGPTITLLAFAPRLGYILHLSDQFAFWPRLGVTYYNLKTKDNTPPTTSTTTGSGLGLDLEPIFVFSPVSHFGFTFGPVADIPLTGSTSRETTPTPVGGNQPDTKAKFMNFGIAVGVLGYF
jgi:hypothetical protein